jgi:predicted alpha-1,2-mannosidase
MIAALGCGEELPFIPQAAEPPSDAPLAGLVDPFVGTANDGQTFPGAVMPWGLASPSPHTTLSDLTTFVTGKIANAGYIHGEPSIHGFGQTHLSGVGCPELGAPVLVPTVGPVRTAFDEVGSTYARERAFAGYYAVELVDPGVFVELTATPRVGVHRLWFPTRAGDANVLIDVGTPVSWHRGDGHAAVVSAREIEGTVTTGFFCAKDNAPTVHFVARFDRDAVEQGNTEAGAFFRFDTQEGEPLTVHVGLSYTSVADARHNLDVEAIGSFEDLYAAAARSWQLELERIRVEGGSEAERGRFYTALYHALLHPNLRSDGVYTVFSLWDTYRTLHPLLTLAYPERQLAMLRSIVELTAELGRPPKWELIGEEVQMMVGDPAAIVVADSYAKGLTDFDIETLYPALWEAAHDPAHRPGLASYVALGYVPMDEADSLWGPVSTTLEYALADAALARLAEALGHASDAAELDARAAGWKALFDPSTGVLRPRFADGSFLEPFDADAMEGSMPLVTGGPGYVEGSAWHYAFFVPHDTAALVALHGEQQFAERLAWVFDSDRFVMWNEPDMAYPYLFRYAPAAASRTHRAARDAMQRFFGDGPAGLPGNDDTGTLSAWFVLSALGLYPDAPGTPRYTIGSPLFDRIEIHRAPGESIVIEALENAPDRPYVAAAEIDGVPLDEHVVDHAALAPGSVLTLHMTGTP